MQTALALNPDDQVILENIGAADEHLGRRRQAIEYIEKALQKGYPLGNIREDPAMASLLADPSFHPK